MKRFAHILALLCVLLTVVVIGSIIAAETSDTLLMPDRDTEVVIDRAGELKEYRFVPEFSCKHSFYSVSEEDTYAELYDADGTLLHENDDQFGMDFGIECMLEAGKEYVLKVAFLDTAAEGTFHLFTSTDHDDISVLVREPDCLEEGEWVHTCKICSSIRTEAIPAEHVYEDGVCARCGTGMVLEGSCGDGLTWHFEGATGILSISGTGTMYDYEEDPAPWYDLDALATEIVVGDGVGNIGDNAFSGLEAVRSVTLAGTVSEIGDNAFSYCTSLEMIEIPNGVRTIGAHAFAYCDQLTEVVISATVTDISPSAFQECIRLSAIRVAIDNANYSSDDQGVLFDREKKELIQAPAALSGHYVIPDTVTCIAEASFVGHHRLAAVTIPESVSQIGADAFANCDCLTFVRIPASVGSIGEAAFGGCTKLGGVLFEGSAPEVSSMVFEDVTATAYHPAGDASWTEEQKTVMGDALTWATISGTDIVTQPVTRDELLGDTVVLTVGAVGDGLRYAWYVADPGSDVFAQSDVIDSIYVTELTEVNVGQSIYCVVTDASGAKVTSQTVTLRAMERLEVDSETSAALSADGQFKYWAFTPVYGCYHTLRSFGGLDIYGELYDAQYNILYTAGDLNTLTEGEEADLDMCVLLEAGKTYIIGIRLIGTEAGTIDLELKTDHVFIQIVHPAGCTDSGHTDHVCSTCGLSYRTDVVAAAGHAYEKTVIEPTCDAAGMTLYLCADCGESYATDPVRATGHDYQATVTAPTCTTNGSTTYTCACGDSYTEILPATGHSYIATVTAPTCTAPGYTTYTCDCGQNYVADEVSATGHHWQDADCTTPMRCATCGEVRGEALGHTLKTVVTDATCTTGGSQTHTCTTCGHSYTDNVVAALGHSYDAKVVPVGCTSDGYTEYTCARCGDHFKADYKNASGHVWMDATCTAPITCTACGLARGEALGHLYSNGICTVCGEKGPDSVKEPGLTLKYPTLSFEDEIFYNVYYTVEDMTSVAEMGLMILSSRDDAATIHDAVGIVPGHTTNGIVSMVKSESVPAAQLGDTVYFKVYAKLTDGSYRYSAAGGYNAKAYASSILGGNNTTEMKALVVAMLNYGAEAQKFFGHNTDKLVDASLTDAQKALVDPYDETMVDDIVKADSGKLGQFIRNNTNFKSLYPSVSFDGAFAINFYCTPATPVDNGMTLYWWDAATYASIDLFTLSNATGKMDMTVTNGQYWGEVAGIAAKDMDKTYYVSCVFKSGGSYVTTGIIPYSLGKYCEGKAATDGDAQQAFAQATAVYGYYAKQYFSSIY